MIFRSEIVVPVIDSSMRGLCMKPYHNHPKGCPNYGKHDRCPPKAPYFKDAFDLNYPIQALWAEFDIGTHMKNMKRKHSDWTEHQLACCLYWQGTVRKFLKPKARDWLVSYAQSVPKSVFRKQGVFYIRCPEAMGINVTATMARIGVKLEWPPRNVTRMIYLGGVKK
jgi:hypothetical protein